MAASARSFRDGSAPSSSRARSTWSPPATTSRRIPCGPASAPGPRTGRGARTDAGALAVNRGDQGNDQDGDDVRDLDHRVDRRAGGVLVGVANRVAGHSGGMRFRALAAEGAVLDELLRVVPGAAARRHGD